MRVDTSKRKLYSVVVILVAGLALAACGQSSDSLPTQGVEATQAPQTGTFSAPALPPAWTQVPGAGEFVVCSCEANLFNCADFSTAQEAQACYDFCGGANNDVHLLDGDLNGISCETYTW